MLNGKQKKQLKDILLTSIVVDNTMKDKFVNFGDYISSKQRYYGGKDPDMSDLSIAFYEILYKEVLPILNAEQLVSILAKYNGRKGSYYSFSNNLFAGDTMNTGYFHPGERSKRKIVEKYRHCLANFWLLPIDIGRKSPKRIAGKGTRDSMIRFLDIVENDWKVISDGRNKLSGKDFIYFNSFMDFDDFIEKHFLTGYSQLTENLTYEAGQIELIEKRAENIVTSNKAEDLWNYFNEQGLLRETTDSYDIHN